MKLKTRVGQIFLTHPRDENFTSVYEETLGRQEKSLELFAVIEVASDDRSLSKDRRIEYEKLAQTIVGALKKTYVSGPVPGPDTFEKALAGVNAAISRIASKGKMHWYGKLNAVVAVILDKNIFLSSAGSGLAYIKRNEALSSLSEGLAENSSGPTKTFSNYSSGALEAGDRVLLTTHELFNYLSMDRISEFLQDPLPEACHEIIVALAEVKDMGFASFICEVQDADAAEPLLGTEAAGLEYFHANKLRFPSASKRYRVIAKYLLGNVIRLGKAAAGNLARFIIDFFQRRPKKYLFIAIGIIVILLVANISYAARRRNAQNQVRTESANLEQLESTLAEAEAALLYDENKVATLLPETEILLKTIKNRKTDQYQDLENRFSVLKSKFSRELRADNPTLLTAFPTVPTDLAYSPNGLLGWNRDSKTLAFYDFRTGLASQLLKSQNTSSLTAAAYVSSGLGYLFIDDQTRIAFLDVAADALASKATSTPVLSNAPASKVTAIDLLSLGESARFYLLDTKQKQIWRSRLAGPSLSRGEAWIRSGAENLADARDMSVDGSIYVLYPGAVEKFFNGQKQSFALGPISPELKNSGRIFTREGYQYLYITDPDNERILIFQKDGKLFLQVRSSKFRDLSDIYVDEKNKVIQALSGSELLQINF